MSDMLRKLVEEAMQDAWNDICADTGCHPLDIERRGKELYFQPRHWAAAIAAKLASDIVGHSTIATGETGPEGFPAVRHEPLSRADAIAILAQSEHEEAERARTMPDDKTAIRVMWSAYQRLRELGWREATYGPTDGRELDVIEAGSSGIHKATRDSERRYWIHDGDSWPSDPVLFREPAVSTEAAPADTRSETK